MPVGTMTAVTARGHKGRRGDADDLSGEQREGGGGATVVGAMNSNAQAETERHQHADHRVAFAGLVAEEPKMAAATARTADAAEVDAYPRAAAPRAPVSDNSPTPCTANDICRAITSARSPPPSARPAPAPAATGARSRVAGGRRSARSPRTGAARPGMRRHVHAAPSVRVAHVQ